LSTTDCKRQHCLPLHQGILYSKNPDEIDDVIEYWHCDNPEDSFEEVFELFSRFGDSVFRAARSMRLKHEDLSIPLMDNSLLSILSTRDYLKTSAHNRVDEIDSVLKKSIPQAFHTDKPKSENDLNDTIQALLTAAGETFTREYPVLKFGITNYRPDLADSSLIIETKFLRTNTSPSVATEGISADITKIPIGFSVLFVVYDPERRIPNDDEFIGSLESKRNDCFVRVYR